jgi:hypothetical protein
MILYRQKAGGIRRIKRQTKVRPHFSGQSRAQRHRPDAAQTLNIDGHGQDITLFQRQYQRLLCSRQGNQHPAETEVTDLTGPVGEITVTESRRHIDSTTNVRSLIHGPLCFLQ